MSLFTCGVINLLTATVNITFYLTGACTYEWAVVGILGYIAAVVSFVGAQHERM